MTIPFGALAPTPAESQTRVLSDLRMGLPCVIRQGAAQTVIAAVETLSQDRLTALCDMFGRPELVLTANRARAVMTVAASVDLLSGPVRITPPETAGMDWFRGLADSSLDKRAGARGPLHVLRGGDPSVQSCALNLVKSAQLLPAVMLFTVGIDAVLPFSGIEVSSAPVPTFVPPDLMPVSAARFPIEAAENGRLHVFRDPTGAREHYALEIGTPDRAQPVLSRLHSACFTGDVLGSLKCDCGPQLRAALSRMGSEGAGVLLYLNQEGRGIGLANKMRVYDLQAQGFDTVEANHRLGFDDDERDFRVAAVMLRSLGFDAARLLTNNPAKVQVFRAAGITITEQLPLRVGRNAHNSGYLATKALKSGHAL